MKINVNIIIFLYTYARTRVRAPVFKNHCCDKLTSLVCFTTSL